MNEPKQLFIQENQTFVGEMEKGKIQVIVLDGNVGTAYKMDVPEHGKTIIQTVKGHFARVDHEIGFKIS
ncbi:XtrA/YqaO family protein [Bacillus safensis]|uniref:XtrA/YqaO family protein n=1 Tax=Bacillus safensis TaxID=561879 RepID=UPI00192BC5D2|nr:XtrA/YqaO family protein [Bacillus safensis]MBL4985106.1 XtrA/YqaO family protein [Bacillus safensis]WHX74508.1 XtrA/YqaO family protein [Bacillus safensis]WHX81966.1 XtrA/YqaO family protein [Bacillus safensis]